MLESGSIGASLIAAFDGDRPLLGRVIAINDLAHLEQPHSAAGAGAP